MKKGVKQHTWMQEVMSLAFKRMNELRSELNEEPIIIPEQNKLGLTEIRWLEQIAASREEWSNICNHTRDM